MAALTHAESKKLYSWWWASHISPKNSKWLQENLTDIDTKVKAMIKLIEEDADSFARKAEMYYKKRPELIKLVEEFYRAYRALAERYDHATGALRQTHKTMAEAFPNQIPFSLFDEPPGSYTSEGAPNMLDMLPSARAMLDYDESQKDASNVSSPYLGIKRSGAYEDRNNKGLKQFNDLLGSGEDKLLAKSPGRMIRQEDVSELSKENLHLKSQITSESARADTAEAQVHRLKETISKMTSEKEAVIRKSLSHSKENCEKLNREILMITEQLKSAEERHLLLEKSNTDVQLELDSIKQRAYEKQEELTKLQEELERLRCSLEEEHLQFLQAEAARLSAEKLHSQSQEEIRLLTRENQTGIEKLKDIEQRKLDIEEELHKLKIENGVLNEQHHASALEIINLQGVILLLRDSKSKLEEEIGIHVDEKKGLLQELARIKEDKNNLERSCHQLTEQIETVNFNLEALQVSVKELQTGNEELKEICLRHENEKLLCLENMKGMEKIAEKNVILESSLSDANAEIEGLREKIKTLEELRESLSGNVTIHTSEKAVLISQVETLFQDMQKLSERNIFLENSLQDETSEIEILNRKMKALEESYQILSAQSSDLHSEKSALASQVEETLQSLENLEVSYTELELKHLNSGVEKDLALQQIMELEDSLKREKEEYETLILSIMLSRKSQLSSLEDQIYLLQEEGQLMKEEFEKEQQRVMDSQFENFILQRCLIDMNDKNSIISEECQKLVEASNSAEKLISELNRTVLAEEKKLASLTGSNEKLREGIWLMIREICHNNHGVPLDDTDDDSLLQLTLHEIRGLLKSFTDTLDENQHLLIEKSILVIILEQFGLNMADQTMREKALENVTESKTKELLLLQSKELELLAASEQLKTDLQVGNGRQEAQKSEMEVLFRQLRVLQEAHDTVQSENLNLLEEIQYMSKTSVDLREKMENLEEENSVILEEAMALETLFVIFKNSTIEKTTESQLMMKDLACLRGVTDGLDRDITLLMEELLATEFENVYLKETVASLGECQRLFTVMEDDLSATRNVAKQFDLEIESGKALLAQKDSELFQANQTLSSTQSKNTDLRMTVEGLQLDINGALVQREELENTIFKLSENNEYMNNEISFLRLENGRLNEELDRLHKVVECLRSREEHLNSDLRKYVDEVNACETEIEMLMNDIQTRTVEAEVYEGKVLELLLTCENLEISAMVQKEMLYDEIARRTAIVDETKEKVDTTERENICLKEELNAYLLLETALWNDATSLEEQILYLASHCTSNLQETTDNQVASLHHLESNHEPSETMETGILGLQKLHAKIQGLQKVVIGTGVLLEQEMVRSNASLKAAVEDIEVLESKGNSGQKEMQISEGIVQQENSQEGLRDNKLPNHDAQNSMTNSEQMMKDIPLDHVSPRREDGFHSYRSSLSENAGINDQDLIMWEQMESNSRNQSQKASSSLAWDDNESQQGSVIGVGRKKDTSEIVPVKVVSIDTQKLRKKNPDSHREHDIKVIGGLSSDAQRLSVLQTSVEELKKKMETSEMNESPRSFEFDTIKAQLKEAEASISQLIDTNSKLKKKAEEFFDSFAVAGYSEMQSNRRQNSERARKISEKVGRLELELHKIQYILSKLTEEHEFKKDRAANRRRVMLKDYLYGRMDNRRRRRILCCMRPKTWED